MPNIRFTSIAIGLFMAAASGRATTFVVPEDSRLIGKAETIATGRVIDTAPRLSDGEVVTDIRIAVDEALKGNVEDVITIVESGGSLGEQSNWIYGTPVYQAGERVLVFLDRNHRGELRTSRMLLGKFAFTTSRSGRRLLLRGSADHGVFGLTESGEEHRELPRTEDGFLAYVRSAVRGEPRAIAYFAEPELQQEYESRLRAAGSSHAAASAYSMAPSARFDNGASKVIPVNLNGAPSTRDWVGSAQRAAAAWTNDPGSAINYSVAGTTTVPFNLGDSADVIAVNVDPAEFNGMIGLGGWRASGSHTFAGERWATIANADVKVSAAAANYGIGTIDAIVCHELGHTLGFRHSNEGTPASSNAIMNSMINRAEAMLGPWDVEAALHVYPAGTGASCTPAAVLGGPTAIPASITVGQSTTLTVTGSGSAPLTYAWFRGSVGDTSSPAGSGPSISVSPSTTTSYWVRVSNSCNAAGARSAALTIPVSPSTPGCGAGNLCFHRGRFRVSLLATDPASGKSANGEPIAENDIFGYFSLPGLTNDPSNREVFVKAVGPVNGTYWVFFGGLTSFQYRLTVTDTQTGQVRTYNKAPNVPNGGFDLGGGVPSESCPASAPPVARASVALTACTAGANQLCLANRFIVRVFARDSVSKLAGFGEANKTTDVFGYYTLAALTNDRTNAEVFVKILDARTVNGKYWLFYGGLTSFEYTISITDSQTGQVREYTKRQNSACGGFDLSLF